MCLEIGYINDYWIGCGGGSQPWNEFTVCSPSVVQLALIQVIITVQLATNDPGQVQHCAKSNNSDLKAFVFRQEGEHIVVKFVEAIIDPTKMII